MRGRAILSATCLVAVVGTSASAQSFGFELTGENRFMGRLIFTPVNPVITVELWAWFDPMPEADLFASANFDIVATDSQWISSTVHLAGPGSSQGSGLGSPVLTGMSATQLHDPAAGIFGSPDNPIHLWTGRWATTDFTYRIVDVVTFGTVDFSVFDQQGNAMQLMPGNFVPGHIWFEEVPAPASAVCLSGFLWLTMRRRRA